LSFFKNIPKVDKVLEWNDVKAMLTEHPRPVVIRAVRAVLDSLRITAAGEHATAESFAEHSLVRQISDSLAVMNARSLKRVVNGTGVVIHTNLGRSPLPLAVLPALEEIAFGYSNLEFDLAQGERGTRYSHVEELLCELTGAEAALVVNNNAAAVLLALSSLAAGREVVVSRGELVEIGGSFRIPDVMQQSGAILREVGTTNRTHPKDYKAAVTADTGLLLKVHCSNFAVIGFTAEVTLEQMVELGRTMSLPVMADAGSGSLLNLSTYLGCTEPTVQEFVKAGVDVITFSGDKLLGGPQAGIIVGKKAYIEPMKKHQLLRALRIDKLTLAALEGTLRIYRDERRALTEIPTLRMLTEPLVETTLRAKRIVRRLRRSIPAAVRLSLVDGVSQVGGGAFPLVELPTTLVAIAVEGMPPQEIEFALRNSEIPVIGRIAKGAFLLDPRTILEDDIAVLAAAVGSLSS
jgi:L-seryl-tRNA(Ser) seleniumtransferase